MTLASRCEPFSDDGGSEICRWRAGMALVAIVAMLGTGVAPAAAQAPDESEPTTISTFGFVPTDSAGTAAQTDVEAQIAEVKSLEASDTPLAAPYDSSKMPSGSAKDRAAMAAGDTAYRIVHHLPDGRDRMGVLDRFLQAEALDGSEGGNRERPHERRQAKGTYHGILYGRHGVPPVGH